MPSNTWRICTIACLAVILISSISTTIFFGITLKVDPQQKEQPTKTYKLPNHINQLKKQNNGFLKEVSKLQSLFTNCEIESSHRIDALQKHALELEKKTKEKEQQLQSRIVQLNQSLAEANKAITSKTKLAQQKEQQLNWLQHNVHQVFREKSSLSPMGKPSSDNSIIPLSVQMSMEYGIVSLTYIHPSDRHMWLGKNESMFNSSSTPLRSRPNGYYCYFPEATENPIRTPIFKDLSHASEIRAQFACEIPNALLTTTITKNENENENENNSNNNNNILSNGIHFLIKNASDHTVLNLRGEVERPAFAASHLQEEQNNRHDPKVVLCTAPLYGKSRFWFEEWIAYQKLMGVDHIAFYRDDQDIDTSKVSSLLGDRFSVHEWSFAPWIHDKKRHLQLYAQADCLYRYRDTADYILYIDTDEFPHHAQNMTYKEFLTSIPDFHQYREFNFRNTFMHRNACSAATHDESEELLVERFTFRGEPWTTGRSKYMVDVSQTWTVGVHSSMLAVPKTAPSSLPKQQHQLQQQQVKEGKEQGEIKEKEQEEKEEKEKSNSESERKMIGHDRGAVYKCDSKTEFKLYHFAISTPGRCTGDIKIPDTALRDHVAVPLRRMLGKDIK